MCASFDIYLNYKVRRAAGNKAVRLSRVRPEGQTKFTSKVGKQFQTVPGKINVHPKQVRNMAGTKNRNTGKNSVARSECGWVAFY